MVDSKDEMLAYDLRQIYAVEIVGTHLKLVISARLEKNYKDYYNALEDLYTVTAHKFKVNKKHNPHEIYKAYMNGVTLTTGRKDLEQQQKNALIEKQLRAIERFLYKECQDAGLFGSKWDDSGL